MHMIADILFIVLLTLVPALELRASIPYGILATEMPWITVFLIAVISNIILGAALFPLLDFIIKTVTRIKIFNKLWCLYIEKTQKKINRYVDRYGDYGIALFIGVPLPGSGSYSGAVAAYLIGMKYRRFIMANAVGVIIAGILVTLIVLSGAGIFSIFVKYPV